jgi:hypothetical protein
MPPPPSPMQCFKQSHLNIGMIVVEGPPSQSS